MWAMYVMTFFTLLVTGAMGQFVAKHDAQKVKRGGALASQMYAYRHEFNKYLTANPSFTGTVSDTHLTKNGFLTPMCNGQMCWGNIVTSSAAYVYVKNLASLPYPLSATELYEISKRSPTIGTKNAAGNFVSYSSGVQAAFGVLPGAIPVGAIVIKVK